MIRKHIATFFIVLTLLFLVFSPICNAYKPIGDPIPDLFCEGDLIYENIIPGSTVERVLFVENIGDPYSELNWKIVSWPDWGEWSFDPVCKYGQTVEQGAIKVIVETIAPNEPLSEYSGEIKIINIDNPDDFCIITLQLKTPKSFHKNISDIQQCLIFNILDRFPNAFPLLRYLLEK